MYKFVLICAAFQLFFNFQITKADCPDIGEISITITDTVTSGNKYIYYNYSFKNVGSDTIFIKNVVIQNYVGTDSSSSVGLSAAGGSFIDPNSVDSLLPGKTYSGVAGAYPFPAHANDPFLITHFFLSGGITECNETDNYFIKRIQIDNVTRIKSIGALDIKWLSTVKEFKILGNYSGALQYLLFDNRGIVRMSGKIVNNENISVPLRPGLYYIEVYGSATKFSRKIIIE